MPPDQRRRLWKSRREPARYPDHLSRLGASLRAGSVTGLFQAHHRLKRPAPVRERRQGLRRDSSLWPTPAGKNRNMNAAAAARACPGCQPGILEGPAVYGAYGPGAGPLTWKASGRLPLPRSGFIAVDTGFHSSSQGRGARLFQRPPSCWLLLVTKAIGDRPVLTAGQ